MIPDLFDGAIHFFLKTQEKFRMSTSDGGQSTVAGNRWAVYQNTLTNHLLEGGKCSGGRIVM